MKLTTAVQAFAIGLVASLLLSSCKGSGSWNVSKPEDYGQAVKMVHTYVITAEEPVNIAWYASSGLGDKISLNGESIGSRVHPDDQSSPEDQTTIEGTQTFSFECTDVQLISFFTIDWDHSVGNKLSYTITLTKNGKVVYTGEQSFQNLDYPDTTTSPLTLTPMYITATPEVGKDGARGW